MNALIVTCYVLLAAFAGAQIYCGIMGLRSLKSKTMPKDQQP